MKQMITGLLLGLSVVFSTTVVAQATSNHDQFSECVAVTSWLVTGRNTKNLDDMKRVQIPEGWKVVGTNIIKAKTPIFFICR